MPTADTSQAQQTTRDGHGDNPFKVTVRTLAGHHDAEKGEARREPSRPFADDQFLVEHDLREAVAPADGMLRNRDHRGRELPWM